MIALVPYGYWRSPGILTLSCSDGNLFKRLPPVTVNIRPLKFVVDLLGLKVYLTE